jgi:gliding motility-associated-like protein
MKPLLLSVSSCLLLLLFSVQLKAQTATQAGQWTWAGGSNDQLNVMGAYSQKGVANANNMPGSRQQSLTWTDNAGKLWLMGGYGYSSTLGLGQLNDLWKYDPDTNSWTWLRGSTGLNARPVMGIKGTPSSKNEPGARQSAVKWIDKAGNLWLMGGNGFGTTGPPSYLNDLWMYNIATNQWTWMGGDEGIGASGVYGIKDTPSRNNIPGARIGAVNWTDAEGNFWLMGGVGYDATGARGYLNDLWKYNVDTQLWTWVSGDNTVNTSNNYGVKGIAAAGNMPGGRQFALSWPDQKGNLWLMGGTVYKSGSTPTRSNDTWKYNIHSGMWTWIGGDINNGGMYSEKGKFTVGAIPGSRIYGNSLYDNKGNIWIAGGSGLGSSYLADVWQFDTSIEQWALINGGLANDNNGGIYGSKGVPTESNIPGGRYGANRWVDNSGNLWLQGGSGFIQRNSTSYGFFNDMWVYKPAVLSPAKEATAITFTETKTKQTQISWTNGNGTARAVFVKKGSDNYAPKALAGVTYRPDSKFGLGTRVDTTKWYCVYNGTGNGITLTNLLPGTTYCTAVVEYNGSAGQEQYMPASAVLNVKNVTAYPAFSSFALSKGILYPALTDTVVNYLVNLPEGTKTFTLTPAATEGNIVTINGTVVNNASPTQISVSEGTVLIPIILKVRYTDVVTNYTLRVNVGKVRPVLTFSPLPVKTYGDAEFFTVTTTSAPDLPVVYSSSNPAVATVVNGRIHILSAGATAIKVQQPGNESYAAPAYINQTLKVAKAPLTVKANDVSREYGLSNPAFGVTYSGFVNGDNDNVITKAPILTTAAVLRTKAGNYQIIPRSAAAVNYSFVYIPGTLNITPVTLTIKANDINKIYGAKPLFSATYTGFRAGDRYTSLVSQPSYSGVTTGTAAGTAIITPHSASSPNYIISYENGNATIRKAQLKIVVSSQQKELGQANPEPSYTANGLVKGDDLSDLDTKPLLSTTASESSPVGRYPIYASGAASANYDITYLMNWLTIVKANPQPVLAAKSVITNSNLQSNADTISASGSSKGAELVVHPAISPNGDGQNDFLYIEGIERYTNNSVVVFDLSGRIVATIKGYDNSTKVFDGRSNGKLQQPGTYLYVIEYQNDVQHKRQTGSLVIRY